MTKRTVFILFLFLALVALEGAAFATTLAPAPATATILAGGQCGDPVVSYGQVYGVLPYAAIDTTSPPATACPGTVVRVVYNLNGQTYGWSCLVGDNTTPGCHYSMSGGVYRETATGDVYGTAFGLNAHVCYKVGSAVTCRTPDPAYSAFG